MLQRWNLLKGFDKRITALEHNTKDYSEREKHYTSRSYPSSNGHASSVSSSLSSYRQQQQQLQQQQLQKIVAPKKKKPKKRLSAGYGDSSSNSSSSNGSNGKDKPNREHILSDEELARQLQAQYNSEAELGTSPSSTISDEEYAQRLQSAYLRREYAAKSRSGSKKDDKKDDKKKDLSSDTEVKPTLWSRLFGNKSAVDDDDDDSDKDDKDLGKGKRIKDKEKEKKDKEKEKEKDKKKSGDFASAYPFPYSFYPQSPYMVNQPGNVQYMPLTTPNGQYMLSNQ